MKNIAIFGCGTAGKAAYLRLKAKCIVAAFLDNDQRKQDSRLFGVPVHNPMNFDYSGVEHVFIASMYTDEILVQLLEIGVPSLKIEYVSDEFLTRNSSGGVSGWWNPSSCIHAFRRMFYVPFRLLR